MLLLYWINIALYFVAPFLFPVYATRRFRIGWLNPVVIPLLAGLPAAVVTTLSGPFFFLDDGLDNPYFQYALLVANVHALAGLLSLVLLTRLFVGQPALAGFVERLARSGGPARPERMRLAAWLFFGLYALSFLLLTRDTGLVAWILDPRTSYQLHRTGVGQWYALCITFLSTSLVLATVYVRSTHTILLLALPFVAAVFLLGQKSLVVAFAIYLLIILAVRRYRYLKPISVLILGGALLLVGSLLAASFGTVGLDQVSQYSDYFVNAAHYYAQYLSGQLPLFGGQVTLTGLWGLAPRSLFPDKPYVYGPILVIEHFFPGAAEKTFTPAFATVDYFADFGWPQAVLSGLLAAGNVLTAFLYALVLPRLNALNLGAGGDHRRVLFYAFLWLAAPSYLVFFDPPNNFILFGLIVALINLVNRVWVTRAVLRPAPDIMDTI